MYVYVLSAQGTLRRLELLDDGVDVNPHRYRLADAQLQLVSIFLHAHLFAVSLQHRDELGFHRTQRYFGLPFAPS